MFQVSNCKVIPFTRIQEDLPKDAEFRAPVGTHKIALQWLATAEGLFEMKCDAQKCSLYLYALIEFREQDYFMLEYSYCIRAIKSERAWSAAASCLFNITTGLRLRIIEIETRVGKRQTVNSRFRFAKINNKYTRIVQNNSPVYGQQ